MHALETKVLKLQLGFHELCEYTESTNGSIQMTSAKPMPGIDGQAIMSAIGKLSLLKMGLENVRLENPPYPVAFDESRLHAVKVDTVEEFITHAGDAIADAEALFKLQMQKKQGA